MISRANVYDLRWWCLKKELDDRVDKSNKKKKLIMLKGYCDTSDLAFKGLIDYSYQQGSSSFHGSSFVKNST